MSAQRIPIPFSRIALRNVDFEIDVRTNICIKETDIETSPLVKLQIRSLLFFYATVM